MHDKPSTRTGYSVEVTQRVSETALYLATKLGDMLDDIVIVGGLVPSLLISQSSRDIEAHVGTMDLDIGLAISILDDNRYDALVTRLREAGFVQDTSDRGNLSRYRWQQANPKVTLDFLIPPSRSDDEGGKLRQIRPDFAAIITPGLHLAFSDKQPIVFEGRTLKGERAARSLMVCGPGAYIVLKALACNGRGANKDAYDLYYVLRNFGDGARTIASSLRPLLADAQAQHALEILRRDFTDFDGVGPIRVAEFLTGGPDDDIQADVVGFVTELLRAVAF